MNKSVIIGIVVLVIVAAGGAALLMNKNSDDKAKTTNTTTSSQSNAATNTATPKSTATNTGGDMQGNCPGNTDACDNSYHTTIKPMEFEGTITIKKGMSVTWTNSDSIAHTVTADSGTGPDSGNLAPGKSYSFTYNTVGTFKYHCAYHSSMTGSVVVTE